jgi:predicted dehydrogenase
MENGIDVLVEKPIAASAVEARELIDVARRYERILQVGHVERFNPAFRAVKDVLRNPWFFEVQRIAPFAGRGSDMDVVSDLMIHDIDIIAHLIEKPIEVVDAVGVPVLTDSIDIANARLVFKGGATANITASRAAFKSERTIRIFQPDLYVSLDFDKKKLKICRKTKEVDERGLPRIEVEECSVGEGDALGDEIESFLEVVNTGGVPVVSGLDGLRALEMVEQIRDACKKAGSFWDSSRLRQVS